MRGSSSNRQVTKSTNAFKIDIDLTIQHLTDVFTQCWRLPATSDPDHHLLLNQRRTILRQQLLHNPDPLPQPLPELESRIMANVLQTELKLARPPDLTGLEPNLETIETIRTLASHRLGPTDPLSSHLDHFRTSPVDFQLLKELMIRSFYRALAEQVLKLLYVSDGTEGFFEVVRVADELVRDGRKPRVECRLFAESYCTLHEVVGHDTAHCPGRRRRREKCGFCGQVGRQDHSCDIEVKKKRMRKATKKNHLY